MDGKLYFPENNVYKIFHSISKFVAQTFYEAEAYGAEKVPKHGPFLLACNHLSYLDPFFAGCFFRRPIFFFARKTLFSTNWKSWLLTRFNSIPVDLENPKDISSLRTVFDILKKGNGLLVFPEGTRSKDGNFSSARPGVGMMACRANVPIVPARMFGTYEAWGPEKGWPKLTTKISIVYGDPIYPQELDPGKNAKGRYQKVADDILDAIIDLKIPSRKII